MGTAFLTDMNIKQTKLADEVQHTVATYRLQADYNVRSAFVQEFEGSVASLNAAVVAALQLEVNNNYFSLWLSNIFIALYSIIGGLQVIGGASLGMYLTDLAIIAKIGQQWGAIYSVAVAMQTTFPALLRITRLLNMPVDIGQRKALSEFLRGKTMTLRANIRNQKMPGIPLDLLPIQFEDLDFSYGPSEARLQHKGLIELQQGQLVSLVGRRGEGKSTLLTIAGGMILPTIDPNVQRSSCGIFVPSHLCVLHMSMEPVFFHGSMTRNLIIGVRGGEADSNLQRVRTICSRLGLPNKILDLIGTETNKAWGEVLSQTQRCLLTLARGLIANFEVLCIHKPTLAYDEDTSLKVLVLLKEFTTHKGVEQDPASFDLRRPRTCLVSSSKALGVEVCDCVLHVSSTGFRIIDKEQIKAYIKADQLKDMLDG